MANTSVSILIDHYAADMKLRRLSPQTIENKSVSLRRMLRWLAPNGASLPLRSLSNERVRSYVADMQNRNVRYESHPFRKARQDEQLSPAYIVSQVQTLKAFGTWLKRERLPNPFETITIPKMPKVFVDVLTEEEVGRVFNAVNPETSVGARAQAMLMLMLDSGLRIGEVVSARMDALDLDGRRLRVMGKGSKERFIRFGNHTGKSLLRYLNLFRPEPIQGQPDALFLALDGMALTTNAARRIVSRVAKRADIPRLHPHLLRHTFAVNYVLNGGDIMTLKELMGHETLSTVMRYQHFKASQVAAAYDNFSPLDRMATTTLRRFGNRGRRTAND